MKRALLALVLLASCAGAPIPRFDASTVCFVKCAGAANAVCLGTACGYCEVPCDSVPSHAYVCFKQ